MKRILFSLLFVFSSFAIKAQYVEDSYDWYPRQLGLKIGMNSTTFNSFNSQMQKTSAEATSKFGWAASVAYWIPITQVFRPRIELSYDLLNADVNYITTSTNGATFQFNGSTRLSQGSLALLPELVFGKHIQFSVFAGFQISALLAAYRKGVQTTVDSSSTVKLALDIDKKDNTISEGVDSGLLVGFGMRYRLYQRIFMNVESRFRFGTSMVYGIYKPYYWGISAGCIYQL